MENKKVRLIHFLPQNELSEKIWQSDDELFPDVKEKLLEISDHFQNYLDIDIDIVDVTLTGSYANYNYTKYSDLDLHLIIEYSDINDDDELVNAFMHAKKNLWNDKYDITINGIDVEIYPENLNEKHISGGVYSITNEKWIIKPEKFNLNPNLKSVNKKYVMIKSVINDVLKEEKDEDINKIIEKIKNMRKAGLERSGEMSIENIVYKLLRANGDIQNLFDTKNIIVDKELSLN